MKKMKGNIVIDLEDYEHIENIPISINSSINVNSYNICVTVKDNEKLKDILSNPDNLRLMEEECIENVKASSEFKEQQVVYKYCAKALKKGIDLIGDCESYTIFGTCAQIIEYINDNPEILEKPFSLPGNYDLTWEDYEKAYCIFGKYPNARFSVSGNKNYRISLDEYRKTLELLDEIVNKVNSCGFSTLEKIMYVYDYVRDRYYNEESKNEEPYLSRGITNVLFGDKIVCEGFVNLFNTILSRLNISCDEFVLSSDDSKHSRSLVYICDPKYDVCGLYMFDPTFDCKKDEGHNHMLRYKYFAKTPKQMLEFDEGRFEYDSYPYFDEFLMDEVVEQYEDTKISYYALCKSRLFYRVNYMMSLLRDSKLKEKQSYMSEYVLDKMHYVNEIASEVIDCNKFAKLLFNVRRVQSLEDPIKYSKDIRMLAVILSRSGLPYPVSDRYQKLLQEVCGFKQITISDAIYCIVNSIIQNDVLSTDEKEMILSKIKKS